MSDVPVVPILLAFDRYPDTRGRYFCVFHDDERPGGKPSAEVRSDPCLLECWSCGTVVTAAELVAQFTGCTRREGLDRAVEIAGTIEPITHGKRRRAPALARAARGRAGAPDAGRAVPARRGSRGSVRREPRVARGVRGLRPLVVGLGRGLPRPRRDPAPGRRRRSPRCPGRRLPPRWDKSGTPRSRFAQLYGVWRLAGQNVIWLREGETDTVAAGFALEPRGAGVLGLPGGLLIPRPADVELFRGARR